MAVLVSFMQPGGLGHAAAVGVGHCRVCESVALDGTTTASAQAGEFVLLGSTETSMVRAAHGTTPDASAGTATAVTTAGYPVPAGQVLAVAVKVGDKVSVKAIA